jgi:serine/threonine-protein kinase
MNTALLNGGSADPEADPGTTPGSGIHAVQRLQPGDTLGNKYRVCGTLGTGGFAVVYEAEHLGLGRMVAIKVMHLEPEMPLALLHRFRQEARISAVVHHPNVLEVYDTGTLEDGSPYLVMERIDGETLFRRMARRGLTIPAVVEVGRQLLDALAVFAERGVVHRDIKPENIMLHMAGDGTQLVKVLDFGISKHTTGSDLKLTRHGALIGTPHYMSPEQIRGEPVDVRADLYAVGVVMYEALTGRVPYDGPSLNALVLAALNAEVPSVCALRPDCPRELERIVVKAMARNRDERYASPAEMQRDLLGLASLTNMPRGGEVWRTLEWQAPPEALEQTRTRIESEDTLIVRPLFAPERSSVSRPLQLAALATLLGLVTFEPRVVPPAPPSARAAALVPKDAADVPGLRSELAHTSPRIEVTQLVHAPFPARDLAPFTALPIALKPEPAREEPARRARPVERKPSASAEAAPAIEPPARAKAQVPPSSHADHLARDHARASANRLGLVRDALAAYVLGDLERAHELYRHAVRDAPDAPEAWRGLGIVAARRGYYVEAKRALAKYLQLSPQAPDAEAVQARSNALP